MIRENEYIVFDFDGTIIKENSTQTVFLRSLYDISKLRFFLNILGLRLKILAIIQRIVRKDVSREKHLNFFAEHGVNIQYCQNFAVNNDIYAILKHLKDRSLIVSGGLKVIIESFLDFDVQIIATTFTNKTEKVEIDSPLGRKNLVLEDRKIRCVFTDNIEDLDIECNFIFYLNDLKSSRKGVYVL